MHVLWLAVVGRLLHADRCDILPMRGAPYDDRGRRGARPHSNVSETYQDLNGSPGLTLPKFEELSPQTGMRTRLVAPCKQGIGMWSTPSGIQVPDEPLGLSIAGHLAV